MDHLNIPALQRIMNHRHWIDSRWGGSICTILSDSRESLHFSCLKKQASLARDLRIHHLKAPCSRFCSLDADWHRFQFLTHGKTIKPLCIVGLIASPRSCCTKQRLALLTFRPLFLSFGNQMKIGWTWSYEADHCTSEPIKIFLNVRRYRRDRWQLLKRVLYMH